MKLTTETYNRIVDNLHDGLYVVDRNRVVQYWNKAAESISGFAAAEVVGKSCADNILTHVDGGGHNLCLESCPLAATIGDGEGREGEVFLHHKDGHRVPVAIRVRSLTDEAGRVVGGVEIFSDLTDKKSIELRIRELEETAFLDTLTRLANRRFMENELRIRLEEFRRFRVPFGVLFMDIDHFKRINDGRGHDVGDLVLRFVAETIIKNSRPFDVMARWGGEEFIGLIRNVGASQLPDLGERLRHLIENSYLPLESGDLRATISIGATLIREGDDVDRLLKRADSLLYESKEGGRNRLTLG